MIRRIGGAALMVAAISISLLWAADLRVDALRQHVHYLADDAREGRGIGTKGLDQSADYLAAQLKEIGLKPAFADGYFQPFDMGWGVSLGSANFVQRGDLKFNTKNGIMPLGFSSAGSAEGTVVFAGYGIIAPEYSYDDFAAVDATGKIALCMTGEPGEFDSTSKFEGLNYTTHSALRAKAANAKLKGAVALLIVEGPLYAAKEKEVLHAPRADEPYSDCGIPALRITRQAVERLFPKFDLEALQRLIDGKTEPRSVDVDTSRVQVSVDLSRKTVRVKNVAGMIPGDSSVVVIGAHYDHLGRGQSGSLDPKPGHIHNGADDNASGVSSVIEIARLLENTPVKSTVFVAFFTAEETGLGGSSYLVKHFPSGMQNIRLMINLDMVGRVRENKLTVIGCKTASEFSDLVAQANRDVGLDITCKGDGYGPSDNMSFYVADKPVLFLFSGAHADYHKSSDDWDKLNYEGMARVVEFADHLVRTIDGYPPALTFVKTAEAPAGGTGRLRSSLGTVPDFSQPDSLIGYLIGDVKPDMAAQRAGLAKGDLVVRVGKVQIGNIYDLMNALRIYAPGDTVDVTYRRGTAEHSTRAVLQASSR